MDKDKHGLEVERGCAEDQPQRRPFEWRANEPDDLNVDLRLVGRYNALLFYLCPSVVSKD